jgi:hypothetical protein
VRSVRDLYDDLKRRPFPTRGGETGNLPLYDGYLAGNAESFLAGTPLLPDDVTEPDEETVSAVNALRNRAARTTEDREVISYFNLLADLRAALVEATDASRR